MVMVGAVIITNMMMTTDMCAFAKKLNTNEFIYFANSPMDVYSFMVETRLYRVSILFCNLLYLDQNNY